MAESPARGQSPGGTAPGNLDKIQHFNERNGLPHNRANAVLQNRQGFVWIGTEDGLARYDGYTFRRFAFPEEIRSQPDFYLLHEDRRGLIWGTTSDGVGQFDPETESLSFFPPDPELAIAKGDFGSFEFVEDADNLWLSSPYGLLRLDEGDGVVRGVALPPVAAEASAPDEAETGRPRQPEVYALAPASDGHLWVGAENGLFRIEPKDGATRRWPLAVPQGDLEPDVIGLHVDPRQTVWAATADGVWHRPRDADRFRRFTGGPSQDAAVPTGPLLHLSVDGGQNPWFLTRRGLHRLDVQSGTSEAFPLCPEATCLDYTHFNRYQSAFDEQGDLWITASGEGLLHFDATDASFRRYSADSDRPDGLATNVLHGLAVGDLGILWLATHFGLDKWDPRRERFRSFSHDTHRGDLTGPGVWAIHQDDAGILWLGSYRDGFSRLDRASRTTVQYPFPPTTRGGPSGNRISAIVPAEDAHLWIATNQGLNHFDTRSEQFTVLRHDPDDERSLSHDALFGLLKDPTGRLWVSTSVGIDILDPASREIRRCLQPQDRSSTPAYAMIEAARGGIWATTLGRGLHHIDSDCRATLFAPNPEGPNNLSSTTAVAVLEDADGILWIGYAESGLDRWDPATGQVENFTVGHGLPSPRVLGILEDDANHLWLATGKGMARFDKTRREFRNFDVDDGLINNTFTIGSVLRGHGGEMFFGGGLGLTTFFPENIVDDPRTPKVHLTDFRLFHQSASLQATDPSSPLQRVAAFTDHLTLDHSQYVFSVELTPLHLANPGKNKLRYKLDGFDTEWIDADATERLAQYSNLQAGTYALQVNAANADGIWGDEVTALTLRVLPPPWKTWWAYSLYASSLALAIWFYLGWQRRRLAREREINRQLRQVDRFKDEFLANTSHELRTPLYGITGLAESLLEGAQGDLSDGARSNLSMIVSSGHRLAGLVNQILDFSKVKQDKMELVRRPVDLCTLSEVVLAIVQPLVRAKDVELVQHVSPDLPPAYGDEDRLHQILLNLVGNAIKFTDEGRIEVTAVEDDTMLTVRVSDTGIGIPQDRQDQIFQAFEQGDASTERIHGGTGLGLAVTRELVTLHGGRLWVDSVPGKGSIFSFTLPVAQENPDDRRSDLDTGSSRLNEMVPTAADGFAATQGLTVSALSATRQHDGLNGDEDGDTLPRAATDANPGETSGAIRRDPAAAAEAPHTALDGRARLLVVDDESVLREVLHNFLAPEGYETVLASSGPQALDLLTSQRYDLVLVDVMMPRMSGFEVCTRIRQRFPAEELPVIFLTAKNQVSDLVRAFGDGASDYLTKPIARQELLSRVRTHLELAHVHRQRARQVKMLTGLLPICSSCKKIRDDGGDWQHLEAYLNSRTEASFSHSICPTCVVDLYPDLPMR